MPRLGNHTELRETGSARSDDQLFEQRTDGTTAILDRPISAYAGATRPGTTRLIVSSPTSAETVQRLG